MLQQRLNLTSTQERTKRHWQVVIAAAFMTLVAFAVPGGALGLLLLAGFVRIVVLTFRTPWLWVFLFIFVFSRELPAVAFVGFTLALILLVKRWRFASTHWSVVARGIQLYILAIVLISPGLWFVNELSVHGGLFPWTWATYIASAVVVSVLMGMWMDHCLLQSKSEFPHYSTVQLLDIMLAAPTVVVMLVLPLVGFAVEVVPEIAPDVGDSGVVPESQGLRGTSEPAAYPRSPHTEVAAVVRPATPATEVVAGHWRTAPDGDPTNNLSYNGSDKTEPGPVHRVSEYERSVADGDPTNNLGS